MARPTVSVIMNCLNGGRYLREALASVRRQTFLDWEIVFWDDGSTDGSEQLATSPCLRYFRGEGGKPLGESRNLAFSKAHGRYLAILDCDDVWEPTKLARQVNGIMGLGLVSSDCWKMDGSGRRWNRYHAVVPFPDGDPYRALLTGPNFLPAPTLLLDADAVRKVGGCHPFYRYAELYDLCVRIAQSYPIAALTQPLACYRFHPGNRGGTGCRHMTREVLDVMRQHRRGAPLRQHMRETALWARYGWQTVTHT